MYNYGAPVGGSPTTYGAALPPFMGYSFNPTFAPFWTPYGWIPYGYVPTIGLGWGLGGERRWGGTYTPQFLLTGLPTDDEIEEMVYDAIDADPLIPYDADITVTSDSGVVTLTGTVPNKQIKHAAGDDAWWVPGVDDVRNELEVGRRRPAREEVAASPPTRAAEGPRRMRR